MLIHKLSNNLQKDITSLHHEYDYFLKLISKEYTNQFKYNTLSFEDFYQESCLCLMYAAQLYNPEKGSFKSYLRIVLNTYLYKFVIKNTKKQKSESIYQDISMDTNFTNNSDFEMDIKSLLDDKEFLIYQMHCSGMSVKEISEKLNHSYEWTRVLLSKVLNKIENYLHE